jgi:hypothetical protein
MAAGSGMVGRGAGAVNREHELTAIAAYLEQHEPTRGVNTFRRAVFRRAAPSRRVARSRQQAAGGVGAVGDVPLQVMVSTT